MREIVVDNFAGGGGASTGIELAIGRSVDIAINHDPMAIAMHKANHPSTEHYIESVWDVDPVKACKGRPVALAWFSPDCKHFSKAKGAKPRDNKIRGLAWIAIKWAKKVKPRVIMLENVEEFKTWGPLLADGMPDPEKKGETFNHFIKQLKRLGYAVDHRELRACDYGAPTIIKRFFLIARCDGKKIVWPEPTHGDHEHLDVRLGLKKPWRTASEIIDWSINCPSIFDRKKPLAENTLKRIAKGIQKFVVENQNPFIVQIGQNGFCKDNRSYSLDKPLTTIVTKAEHCLVTPFLTSYHSETTDNEVRGLSLDQPLHTLDTSNRFGLVTAFISKYYGGFYDGAGSDLNDPISTMTTKDHNAVVTSHLIQLNKNCIGQDVNTPIKTITSGAGHFGEVRTFLMTYYGNSEDVGQKLDEPLRTITTKDRFGIVKIHNKDYQIVDIGMRMLEPEELKLGQGFPANYIINRDAEGKAYPKTQQVAKIGNSVCPPLPKALVEANMPELCGEMQKQGA